MHVDLHSERADHPGMPTPMRLERNAPIRRDAAEQAGPVEGIYAERVLRAEAERLVAA